MKGGGQENPRFFNAPLYRRHQRNRFDAGPILAIMRPAQSMHPQKSYIEILPAALLSKRPVWQKQAAALPPGTCLLVTDRHHSDQTRVMQLLAQSFRAIGRPVVVWHLGRKNTA